MTKYKEVEDLLENYSKLEVEIKGIECLIKAEGLKGIFYDDMPKSPNINTSSPVEGTLYKLDRLRNDKLRLEIKKESMDNMFKLLTRLEYDIMKLKYIEGLSKSKIARELDIHENTVSKRHKDILEKCNSYCIRYKLI